MSTDNGIAQLHSLDAERSVLGGLLLRPALIGSIALEVPDFFSPKHQAVFEVMRSLDADGAAVDAMTVADELRRTGKAAAVGRGMGDEAALGFVMELSLLCPSPENVAAYAAILGRYTRKRAALDALATQMERVKHADVDGDDVVAEVIGDLQRLDVRIEQRDKPRGAERVTIRAALADLARIVALPVYPTPFPAINDALGLGGLVCRYATLLAGGTGVGKTTWLLAVARHHARHHGPVLFVSLEMPSGHLIARAAAGDVGVSANDLLLGRRVLDRDEVPLLDRLEIVESCSLAQLGPTVEAMIEQHGQAPLVIVDYLQKLADQVMAKQARPDPRLATTEASAALLALARRYNLPLVVASAVSRGAGSRIRGGGAGKKFDPRSVPPVMFDDVAKESGAVEYDSAGLIVLHVSDDTAAGGGKVATMTVAKSRFGYTCHVDAVYEGAAGRWHDRGQVERPAHREPSGDELAAERQAGRAALGAKVLALLAVGSMSTDALRERLKVRRTEVVAVLELLMAEGQVVQRGRGSRSTNALPDRLLRPDPGGA